MNIFGHRLLRHPLALVSFCVSTLLVGTPLQVKAAQVIPQNQLSIFQVDSQQNDTYAGYKSIDGNPSTMWHTQWSPTRKPMPHQLTLQLSSPYIVSGLRYLPRQDGWSYGIITAYAIYVSTDGTTWGTPVAQGRWPGTSALQEVTFAGVQARYVRLVATASAQNFPYASAAEINLLGSPGSTEPPTTSSSTTRNLSWIDNATNEDGFKIERKIGITGTFVRLAVVNANTTSYSDTNAQSGTVYCYRVQAFNTSGDSPFSNEACASPQPAGSLVTSGSLQSPETENSTGAPSSQDNSSASRVDRQQFPLAVAIGVFRPQTASWYLDSNSNGQFDGCAVDTCSSSFGLTGDLPVIGDWRGSGISQLGVFSPGTHMWDLDANYNALWDACEADLCLGPFGKSTDLPVSGYWQGKGNPARIGIFRPQTGEWILDTNGNGRVDQRSTRDTRLGPFGTATDLPVVGDWTGTGKSRIGTFAPNSGQWQLDQNDNGIFDGCTIDRCVGPFGKSDSYPIAADWLGSGTSQIGIFDPATGMWQLDTNGNGIFDGCGIDRCIGPFGQAGDIPLVGQW